MAPRILPMIIANIIIEFLQNWIIRIESSDMKAVLLLVKAIVNIRWGKKDMLVMLNFTKRRNDCRGYDTSQLATRISIYFAFRQVSELTS